MKLTDRTDLHFSNAWSVHLKPPRPEYPAPWVVALRYLNLTEHGVEYYNGWSILGYCGQPPVLPRPTEV